MSRLGMFSGTGSHRSPKSSGVHQAPLPRKVPPSLRSMGPVFMSQVLVYIVILLVCRFSIRDDTDSLSSRQRSHSDYTTSQHAKLIKLVKPFSQLWLPYASHEQSKHEYSVELSTLNENKAFNFFFRDYVQFHSMNRYNASRVLIFRPYRTGLGDQFGLMVHAYWCAVMSRRVFLIDWRSPFSLSTFLSNAGTIERTDFYMRESDEHYVDMSSNTSDIYDDTRPQLISDIDFKLHNGSRVHALLRADNDARTVIVASRRTLASHDRLLLAETMLTGRESASVGGDASWMARQLGSIDFDMYRSFTRHVLRPSEQVQSDYDDTCTHLGLRCGSGNSQQEEEGEGEGRRYISVHARIGVGVGETVHERFRNLSRKLDVVAACLGRRAVRLADSMRPRVTRVFLATDTPAFRAVFAGEVAARSRGRVSVVCGKWGVLHSKRLKRGTQMDRRMTRGVDNMWRDLMLLGHGEHVVAMRSSFARMALAVGDARSLTELRGAVCQSEGH